MTRPSLRKCEIVSHLFAVLLLLSLASPASAIIPLELSKRWWFCEPIPPCIDYLWMDEIVGYGDDGAPHHRPVKLFNPRGLVFLKTDGSCCRGRAKWSFMRGRYEIQTLREN